MSRRIFSAISWRNLSLEPGIRRGHRSTCTSTNLRMDSSSPGKNEIFAVMG